MVLKLALNYAINPSGLNYLQDVLKEILFARKLIKWRKWERGYAKHLGLSVKKVKLLVAP